MRKLLSRAGFSLVEVMVATGMVGALSLGVAHLMKQSSDTANYAEVRTEENEIYRQISLILQDKDGCTNTLTGLTTSSPVPSILNGKGMELFKSGNSYGNNSVELTSIQLVPQGVIAPEASGSAGLQINMRRKKVKSARPVVSKTITINVKLDVDSKIVSCYGVLDQLVANNNKESCENANGTWIDDPGICEYNDCDAIANTNIVSTLCMNQKALYKTGGTATGLLNAMAGLNVTNSNLNVNTGKICIDGNCRDFGAKSCDPGWVVIGVQADGTMNCQPAVKAVEASPVDCKGTWSGCSSLCGPGTQTYSVTSPKVNNGADCETFAGDVRSCNSGACVNCSGSFSACSATCGGGTQSYTYSQAAGPGGAPCPYPNGYSQSCNTNPCYYNCPNIPSSGCATYTKYSSGSGSSITYYYSCTNAVVTSYPSQCTGGPRPSSTCNSYSGCGGAPAASAGSPGSYSCGISTNTHPCTP